MNTVFIELLHHVQLQAIFSCVNDITANSLYPGILMIG